MQYCTHCKNKIVVLAKYLLRVNYNQLRVPYEYNISTYQTVTAHFPNRNTHVNTSFCAQLCNEAQLIDTRLAWLLCIHSSYYRSMQVAINVLFIKCDQLPS